MKNILTLICKTLKIESKLFFVGSSDALPPPLSKEDELTYVLKCKEGDMHARNILIEHNLRLVVFLSKKYESTGYDLEDLVSIGSIGLIKGIQTYKPDKNIKLATYCSRCISNEILMFLRKNKKRRSEISFEDALSFDSEGNELHLEDILGTEEDIVYEEFSNKIDKESLERELNFLDEREKIIMVLRYGLNNTDDYTQKEVAEMLGISQSYISRIEKKVVKRLQNLLETR
ncbi:MAG: RNA polymerase sporulation sigma factor SigK [Bacilli bacterium]|nr:RNA polymerase sporulation sigma factor SigK [Bacilli bacterium]MDD4795938.1 RNA polymerase sporulation sigma factor SigK [Bacilli bacterium]